MHYYESNPKALSSTHTAGDFLGGNGCKLCMGKFRLGIRKKFSLAEWSGIEISCLGSQWSHHLWKCSSVERMRQPKVNNTFFTVTLTIQVLIFVERKEQDKVFNKIIIRFISLT